MSKGAGFAWRALGLFWLGVLAGGAGGIAWLDHLGPLPAPPQGARLQGAAPQGVAPQGVASLAGLAPRDTAPPASAAAPAGPTAPAMPPALSPATPAAIPQPAPVVERMVERMAERGVEAPAALRAPPAPPDAPPKPPTEPPTEPPLATAPRAEIVTAALPPPAAPEPPLAPPEAPAPPPLPPPLQAAREAGGGPIPPPDPALLENSPYGPLPRVTTDGREPRLAYARPFPAGEARPRIALVVGGFGLSPARSEEAIRRLPAATTLAFIPQALRPDLLLAQARARGMEVVLGLPLDSGGAEPGEFALRPGLALWENQERLHRALGRMAGYAGVIGALSNQRGERFATDRAQLDAVQEEMQARGLYYLEPRPGAPAPAEAWGASADLILDEPLTRGELERRLTALEGIARERGSALGLAAEPAPLLVDRIAAWAAGLEERGFTLAPASAVTRAPASASPSASR